MISNEIPPPNLLEEPKGKSKASSSGSKITPIKSTPVKQKIKSSPTELINSDSIKRCSNSELRMIAQALNERLSNLYEEEEVPPSP